MTKKLMAFLVLVVACVSGIVFYFNMKRDSDLPPLVNKTLTDEEFAEVVGRNSSLTEYVQLVASADFPRTTQVNKITIHHTAGIMSLKDLGEIFSDSDRSRSANYAIDVDGKVGLYVEERNRAWTSGNVDNDDQAITIEVVNDEVGGDWHVSSKSYESLIRLCTDICRRNHIDRLVYTGDDIGNFTAHCMFADTSCPGPYLKGSMSDIAFAVNNQLMVNEFYRKE